MRESEKTGIGKTESEMTGSGGNPSDPLVGILANEEEIQPLTGFSTRVLRQVREEAAIPAPMAFPWTRFLAGFVLNLGLLFGAGIWGILESGGSSGSPAPPPEWLSSPQLTGLMWVALAVIGTGLLAWTASRWVAPRNLGTF